MKNKKSRCLAMVLNLMLIFSLLPMQAFARERVETDRTCSLTLEHEVSGAEFSVYKVGTINAAGELSLTGDFQDYSVSLEQDQEGWRALAQTLESYAIRDELVPAEQKSTDENKRVRFSDLEVGLYLVSGKIITVDDTTYIPQPFLICLPNLYDETQPWVYDVTANLKYDKETEEHTTREVLKIWKDEAGKTLKKHPESIEVELLQDGKVYDTVKLNAENNWRYTWENLDDDYTWKIVEKKVPDGYKVVIEENGITFVITNTKTDTPKSPGGGKIPQTGLLWWPVGILLSAGLAFVLVGWLRQRKNED